jgi:hypothetical protein
LAENAFVKAKHSTNVDRVEPVEVIRSGLKYRSYVAQTRVIHENNRGFPWSRMKTISAALTRSSCSAYVSFLESVALCAFLCDFVGDSLAVGPRQHQSRKQTHLDEQNVKAMASPIPEAAPVTNAILLVRSNIKV